MTLEQYTDDKRQDAFIYWLEILTQDLGGIRGGSAFKFGISRRRSKGRKPRTAGRAYNARYMWLERHGATPQEAFASIRQLIVDVVDAVQAGRLEAIDTLKLSPVIRWKLAFLYQPRTNPLVFPIFKHQCLFDHYRQSVDPKAVASRTGFGQMYRALSERLRRLDVFERADGLWGAWEKSTATPSTRDWLIPLEAFGLKGELAQALAAQTQVEASTLPLALKAQLIHKGVSQGDRVALLSEGLIQAHGWVEGQPEESLSWRQLAQRRAWEKSAQHPDPQEITEVTSWKLRELIWGEQPPLKAAAGLCPDPTCTIFYGPPGTGKTRQALRQALGLCGVEVEGLDDDAASAHFDSLQREGRVEVVTFHPSYGYEEFVEGIRPVLGASGDLGYRCQDGAFKRLALSAAAEGLLNQNRTASFDALWQRMLDEVRDAEGDYLIESLDGTIHALGITSRGNLEARRMLSVEAGETWLAERKQTLSKGLMAMAWRWRQAMGAKPTIQSIQSALGGLPQAPAKIPAPLIAPVLQGLKDHAARLEATVMVGQERSRRAQEALQEDRATPWRFDAQSQPHVLIIDEINRGNIPRIMGELITLLEPERRLGAAESTVVRLPVSSQRFGLPPNLHVIGTMNTADRSIAMMDVALRRRFTFTEHMPRAEVIDTVLEAKGCDKRWRLLVKTLFETLNARIRYLYDREHQLGHAYFLGATDPERLRQVMVERVFPLLQEYFFDAWSSVCLVLGCPYDDAGVPLRNQPHCLKQSRRGPQYTMALVEVERMTEADILGIPHGEREDRLQYRLNERLLHSGLEKEALMACFEAILPAPLEVEAL